MIRMTTNGAMWDMQSPPLKNLKSSLIPKRKDIQMYLFRFCETIGNRDTKTNAYKNARKSHEKRKTKYKFIAKAYL